MKERRSRLDQCATSNINVMLSGISDLGHAAHYLDLPST